jgi:hypothetical protein
MDKRKTTHPYEWFCPECWGKNDMTEHQMKKCGGEYTHCVGAPMWYSDAQHEPTQVLIRLKP